MTRVLYADAATLRPSSERDTWNAATRILWDEADATTRRAALSARWRLRCAEHPEEWPLPACPLARALCVLELSYRKRSYCRGGVDGG